MLGWRLRAGFSSLPQHDAVDVLAAGGRQPAVQHHGRRLLRRDAFDFPCPRGEVLEGINVVAGSRASASRTTVVRGDDRERLLEQRRRLARGPQRPRLTRDERSESIEGVVASHDGVQITDRKGVTAAAVVVAASHVAGRGGRGGFSPGTSGTDGADGSAEPIFVSP